MIETSKFRANPRFDFTDHDHNMVTVGELIKSLSAYPADTPIAGTWESVIRGIHAIDEVTDKGGKLFLLLNVDDGCAAYGCEATEEDDDEDKEDDD